MIIAYPASSSATFAAGMPVFLDGINVFPASEFAWNTDLQTTLADFSKVFVGIATGPRFITSVGWKVNVEVSPNVPIAFTAKALQPIVGRMYAPAEGNIEQLSDTEWQQVVSPGQAVARCIGVDSQFGLTGTLTIASSIHTGSSNINAQLGT